MTIWAYIERPPVPCTRTVSPPLRGLCPIRALYAVSTAHLSNEHVSTRIPRRENRTHGSVDASSYERCS